MHLAFQTTRVGNASQDPGQIFRTMARAPPSDKTSTVHFDRIIEGENTLGLRTVCLSTLNNEMVF